MTKTLVITLLILCLIPYNVNGQSNHDEKKFRYNKVECSYDEAEKIILKAAIEKYPEYKKNILNCQPGIYEAHGGGQSDTIGSDFILIHKDITASEYINLGKEKDVVQLWQSCGDGSKKYYEESIEVILNNSCEVLNVLYHKRLINY